MIFSLFYQFISNRKSGFHMDSDHIVGVMGMDLKLKTLSVLINENFPLCKEDTNRLVVFKI